jgi:hypothetical protein
VLTLSAFGLARLSLGISLPALPLTVPRGYLALSGGVWAAAGLATAVGLFYGARWAPRLARAAAIVLAAWYWGDRLLFVQTDFARQSWPAALSSTLAALLALFWVLRRSTVRHFFGE